MPFVPFAGDTSKSTPLQVVVVIRFISAVGLIVTVTVKEGAVAQLSASGTTV
jgi:hypothetical protein